MKTNKLLPLILTLVCSYFLLSPNTSIAADEAYDGQWRGELDISSSIKLAIGIEISDNNTTLTLSSPNQGMHKRKPTSFSISGNTIRFTDDGLKASFEGTVEGDTLSGTFTQGQARPLILEKLSTNDLERLRFEGKYIGDLQINKNATLPLVLHVAVIPDGFSAMLDSPSQNSFGIPINDIAIDKTTLSFTSSILGAKFEGESDEEEASEKSDLSYAGVFIQGMPLPLTLTKVTANNAHLQFEPADFGEKGGSVTIVSLEDTKTRFWNGHTQTSQYEIGSITKTFVSLLLAQQHTKNKLKLSSTLDKYFPKSPALSMLELATHTSGLERLPPSIHNNVNPANPYAHITREMLASDLASINEQMKTQANNQNDKQHLYSNFGYAVLGEALAMQAGSSLSDMMQNSIFEPLNMQGSYLSVEPNHKSAKLVQGHDSSGNEVPAWSLGAVSGAGAIVSTLDDMISYAQYMMKLSTQNPALSELLFDSYQTMSSCCQQGLAWILMEDENGKRYAWHNGMTGGFSAFIGFYLDGSRAVVMLNNQSASFDDKAHALLRDDIALQSI